MEVGWVGTFYVAKGCNRQTLQGGSMEAAECVSHQLVRRIILDCKIKHSTFSLTLQPSGCLKIKIRLIQAYLTSYCCYV